MENAKIRFKQFSAPPQIFDWDPLMVRSDSGKYGGLTGMGIRTRDHNKPL